MAAPDEQTEHLESPSPPRSPEETVSTPPLASPEALPRSPPPLRMQSDMTSTSTLSNMSATSRPLGNINAARGPPPGAARAGTAGMGGPNPDIAARMRAFHLSRQNTPAPGTLPRAAPQTTTPTPVPAATPGGFPANLRLPPNLQRPGVQPVNSSPVLPVMPGGNAAGKGLGLAEKRGMKLPGGLSGAAPSPNPAAPGAPAGRKKPGMKLSDIGGAANGGPAAEKPKEQTQMEKYAEFVDTKNGALTFKGKATVTAQGIEFTSGKSFHISLEEVDTLDELGKGNYGTVYKVRHARPKFRRAGQGLAGNKAQRPADRQASEDDLAPPASPTAAVAKGGTTGIVMAMKEMRLELDDAKFQSIIMELDTLHKCISPYIVDFYGAFFQEGCVFICMEYMDGGSLDKLYGDGVPENVLRKITLATVLGLKSLKDEHNIIHRDVKPTNVLVNSRGQVKICDFGVSGNLVASIAKTNVGCQSYMAPERISGGGMSSAGTYSVQSDIWSLGLTIIECGMGRYPYPPETYDNIFSQLSAIVDGVPPDLPEDQFSEAARDFAAGCLNKIPKLRPTYPMLLQHAWLAPLVKPSTIMEEDEDEEGAENGADGEAMGEVERAQKGLLDSDGVAVEGGFIDREVGEWVIAALDRRRRGVLGKSARPALDAAPLDSSMANSPQKKASNAGAVAV